MTPYDARKLREAWGGKPCDHPDLTPDYGTFGKTGDYICTQCGEEGWGKDWPQKEAERKKKQASG